MRIDSIENISNLKYLASIFAFTLIVPNLVKGQGITIKKTVYKTVSDSINLHLYFIRPENYSEMEKWPVMVFFHGGGWNSGSYKQFLPQAKHFARSDFQGVLVEYRVHEKHNSSPFESLMDAKSSIRFLKRNAFKYRIDTTRMIAVGGSAGGHLAAALELISGYNDPRENTEINTHMDGLILLNPVLDNGPGDYGYNRVGDAYRRFSPFYQSKKGMAPTLIMSGTKDNIVDLKTLRSFCCEMKAVNSQCDLVLYKGQRHGFFNEGVYYEKTIKEIEVFLDTNGFSVN